MNTAAEWLSPAEERFELWRRRSGLILGPVAALLMFAVNSGLPHDQRLLSGILILVMVFWITEAIPIPATALLGPSLCVLVGIGDARTVYRSFANPIIYVFMGGFLLARAMTVNGLDRRVALMILRNPAVGHSPERIRTAVGVVAVLLSMWISNSATTAILFPIVVGIGETLDNLFAHGDEKSRRRGRSFVTGLLLMLAYSATLGGLSTPIGSPPNLIGLGMLDDLAERRITFFDWMLVGVPVTTGAFVFLVLVMRLLHPSPLRRLEGLEPALDRLARGLPAWGRGQTYTMIAFATAVVLWILPGAVAIIAGRQSALFLLLSDRLQEGVVALLAASLLFLLPVSFSPPRGALDWSEAVKIDWGTILLFGGGLSLGEMMTSTGLAGRLAQGIIGGEEAAGLWTITAVATIFSSLISETTSNTASASMVVPVTIAVARAAGVPIVPPVLGATLAASMAFVLPVSTPPNAIVYGSGRISIVSMIRAGIWMDIICFLVAMLVLWRLCGPLGFI